MIKKKSYEIIKWSQNLKLSTRNTPGIVVCFYLLTGEVGSSPCHHPARFTPKMPAILKPEAWEFNPRLPQVANLFRCWIAEAVIRSQARIQTKHPDMCELQASQKMLNPGLNSYPKDSYKLGATLNANWFTLFTPALFQDNQHTQLRNAPQLTIRT